MMDMAERRRLLLEGLVGEHQRLYQESPQFRRDVIGLLDALPLIVDFGAQRAEQVDEHRKAMRRLAEGLDIPEWMVDSQRPAGYADRVRDYWGL